MKSICDLPLAAYPFTSYRYAVGQDWIMIGAMNDDEALAQAQLSLEPSTKARRSRLQRFDGTKYRPVIESH